MCARVHTSQVTASFTDISLHDNAVFENNGNVSLKRDRIVLDINTKFYNNGTVSPS